MPINIKGLLSGSNFSISINAIYTFLNKRISFSHESEMRFLIDRSSEIHLPLPKETLIQVPNQADDHNLRAALEKWQEILTEKLEKMKKTSTGLKVKIKPKCMDYLIERVYISPRSPSWFDESLVKRIINRYGLSCNVKKSDLNVDPLF